MKSNRKSSPYENVITLETFRSSLNSILMNSCYCSQYFVCFSHCTLWNLHSSSLFYLLLWQDILNFCSSHRIVLLTPVYVLLNFVSKAICIERVVFLSEHISCAQQQEMLKLIQARILLVLPMNVEQAFSKGILTHSCALSMDRFEQLNFRFPSLILQKSVLLQNVFDCEETGWGFSMQNLHWHCAWWKVLLANKPSHLVRKWATQRRDFCLPNWERTEMISLHSLSDRTMWKRLRPLNSSRSCLWACTRSFN